MKRIIIYLFLIPVIIFSCNIRLNNNELSIIPKPNYSESLKGNFRINGKTKILTNISDPDLVKIGKYFAEQINKSTGFNIEVQDITLSNQKNTISLILQNDADKRSEAYSLLIEKKNISITAAGYPGVFYAVQTLRQLLPPEFESSDVKAKINWIIPCLKIVDEPVFEWRGMLLDCSRHFMDKEFIKRYIDLLAYHKMNKFHLHLTDDHGWRIEIKKYPKLTEVGAWRVDREKIQWGKREPQKKNEEATYGGFYTQEDIKEIVEYANSKYVTIIPEIDIPGHSLAAMASYPELSCTGGPSRVNPGGPFSDTDINVFCAGKEKTFDFLEDVLEEVINLFPSEYIHIGGDECDKKYWKVCPDCQSRMLNENLKNEEELQSYFIKRIEKFVNSKGRKIIGWDEILQGGLAPNATVQAWWNLEKARTSVLSGHDVICSPMSHTYLDYSPLVFDLQLFYSFNPIPGELTKEQSKHILGGECNMWTEKTPQHKVDSMVFPRLLAISEVLWTKAESRDFMRFHQRVRKHYEKLDFLGVEYGPEGLPVSIIPRFDENAGGFLIGITSGKKDAEIHYSINGDYPDHDSRTYNNIFLLQESRIVKAAAYRNGKLWGTIDEVDLNFHKAVGKTIVLNSPYHYSYPGIGEKTLVDGISAPLNFRDNKWLGFKGNNMEATIDLEYVQQIKKVSVSFLQNINKWIFPPSSVEISISVDGKNFETITTMINDNPDNQSIVGLQNFSYQIQDVKVRFVKINALNIAICPDWHVGKGESAWLFVDEIVIE
ncbi:family 20 glycosylhydrolase [Bacteroidota bacterium]